MLCREIEVEQYRPVFQTLVDSASFEEGYGYDHRPVLPLTSAGSNWLLLWAALVVVVVFLWRRSARRSHASKSA
jgi:hypothetical protein